MKGEALKICASIVTSLSGLPASASSTALVKSIFDAVYATTILKDIDQDVKEASLYALSLCICNFSVALGDDALNTAFPVIISRLQNELTRVSALRAITKIASSTKSISLSSIINACMDDLLSFLRKDSATLKQETITTLTALIQSNSASFNTAISSKIIKEVSPLIRDQDLHLTHLTLTLISAILAIHPNEVDVSDILKQVLIFAQSALLQGNALKSVVTFFQSLLLSKRYNFQSLTDELVRVVNDDTTLHTCMCIAQCIAGMAASPNVDKSSIDATISRFLVVVKDGRDKENIIVLALLILGEIGRVRDLSSHRDVDHVVFASFSSDRDAIKNAAAYALGSLSCGNMSVYLPHLLSLIEQHEQRRYQLLTSLMQMIKRMDGEALKPYIGQLIPLLLSNTESKEEGTRSQVAECIGGLAIIDDATIIPIMLKLVKSSSPYTRDVVVTALRHSLSPFSTLSLTPEQMEPFFELLRDSDLVTNYSCSCVLQSATDDGVLCLCL